MISKQLYFRIVSTVMVMTILLPVLAENLPKGFGSYKYLWLPIWILSLALFEFNTIKYKVFIHFLIYLIAIYILIPTIWFNVDEWFANNITMEIRPVLVGLSVYLYYIKTEDYYGLALIGRWILIFMIITAIMSTFATFIDPLYARKLINTSTTGFAETAQWKRLKQMGAGNFGFAQSLIILAPLVIYYFKYSIKSIFSKPILLVFYFIIIVTTLRMQFFANVLILAAVSALAFSGAKNIKKSAIITTLIISIFLLVPKQNYANLLLSLSTYIDSNSDTYEKVTDMASFLTTGKNDRQGEANIRLSRFPKLYNAWVKKPLFGNAASENPDNIQNGYHLHWMGKLGATGLLGFILFFYPHVVFLRFSFKKYDKDFVFFGFLSVLTFFALGLLKQIEGREIWLTYFIGLPGISYMYLLKEKKDKNKEQIEK